MLVCVGLFWTRSQVPNLESFTCARCESSGRSRGRNSTKRTQTTDTRRCQTVIFAQKFRPAVKRAPLGRAAWFGSSWDRLALRRRGQACKLLLFGGRNKNRLQEETDHQFCPSSTARFPLPFLLLEKVLTIRLPNRLLKIRPGVASDEDLPVEHQQRFRYLRFFAHLSTPNRVSTKSGLHYLLQSARYFQRLYYAPHRTNRGTATAPFQTIANGSFNTTI
jgi:hypothetical protein